MKNVVLEPSTNTHTLKGNVVKTKKITDSIMTVKIEGEGIVTHGQHGTIRTESPNVIKYVQQEKNPVTQKMMNAFD